MSSTLHPIIPLSLLVNIDTVKPMEQVCLTLVPMNPSMSTTFYFYSHRIQFAVIVLLSSELLIATYHGIVIEILNSKEACAS